MSFIHDDFLLTNPYAVRLYHEFARMNRFSISTIIYRPKKLPKDRRFNNLAEIWLEGDHYKWRALRANGIPEELVTGNGDPKEKYLAWAATIPHTLGNPLYHWTHLELKRCFDIDLLLSPETAENIWEQANEKLAEPDFSARGMLKRFQVKALCTTDDPAHPLPITEKLLKVIQSVRSYPTFRPDQAWGIDHAQNFIKWIESSRTDDAEKLSKFRFFLTGFDREVGKISNNLGSRLSDHSFPYFFSQFPMNRKQEII